MHGDDRAVLMLDQSHCRSSHSEAWTLSIPSHRRGMDRDGSEGSQARSEKGPRLQPDDRVGHWHHAPLWQASPGHHEGAGGGGGG